MNVSVLKGGRFLGTLGSRAAVSTHLSQGEEQSWGGDRAWDSLREMGQEAVGIHIRPLLGVRTHKGV